MLRDHAERIILPENKFLAEFSERFGRGCELRAKGLGAGRVPERGDSGD